MILLLSYSSILKKFMIVFLVVNTNKSENKIHDVSKIIKIFLYKISIFYLYIYFFFHGEFKIITN